MLLLSTAEEKASYTSMEKDREVSKPESLLEEHKSSKLSFEKVTTARNDLVESKSELTLQIAMISSGRDRSLCKCKELQGEIDLRIKRCDELEIKKENQGNIP